MVGHSIVQEGITFPCMLLTLGVHAQRGLLYLVCLSVRASSRTTGYEAANEWHQQVVDNEEIDINVAIVLK